MLGRTSRADFGTLTGRELAYFHRTRLPLVQTSRIESRFQDAACLLTVLILPPNAGLDSHRPTVPDPYRIPRIDVGGSRLRETRKAGAQNSAHHLTVGVVKPSSNQK